MYDADSLRSELATACALIAEGADDHFYGAWRGGSKEAGGHAGEPVRLAEPPEFLHAPPKGSRVTITDREGTVHHGVIAGYDAESDSLVLHSEFGKGEKVLPRRGLKFDRVEPPPGKPHERGTIAVPPRLPPQYGGAIPMPNPPATARRYWRERMRQAASIGLRDEFQSLKAPNPPNRLTDRMRLLAQQRAAT